MCAIQGQGHRDPGGTRGIQTQSQQEETASWTVAASQVKRAPEEQHAWRPGRTQPRSGSGTNPGPGRWGGRAAGEPPGRPKRSRRERVTRAAQATALFRGQAAQWLRGEAGIVFVKDYLRCRLRAGSEVDRRPIWVGWRRHPEDKKWINPCGVSEREPTGCVSWGDVAMKERQPRAPGLTFSIPQPRGGATRVQGRPPKRSAVHVPGFGQ